MDGRHESALVPVLLAVVVPVASNLVAFAINEATSATDPWPWGLEAVRANPFAWALGLTALTVIAGLVAWWLPQRSFRHDRSRPVPPQLQRPEWVVDRQAEVGQIVAALRAAGRHRRGDSSTVGITTGLHGAGGFGKTTLALVVGTDPRVRRWFGNRIFMVTVGRDVRGRAAIVAKVNEVIKEVTGEEPAFTDNPEPAGRQLGSLLDQGPRVLLILDDLWEPEQLKPFLAGGRRCVRLVTTRSRDLLVGRGSAVTVDQMSEVQAEAVLIRGLSGMTRTVVADLLEATGRWPLLLRLVNKILADTGKTSLDLSEYGADLCRRLLAGGPQEVDELTGEASRPLDVNDPEERVRAVRATIEASTDLLDEPARARFGELAVFADDEAIPVDLIGTLWHATAGLDQLRTRLLCARLDQLALVSTTTVDEGGTIGLHDVVRDYLRQDVGSQRLAELHGVLLDAVAARLSSAVSLNESAPAGTAWWELGEDARYLSDHLIEHLRSAGRVKDADRVAGDLRWVGVRLERYGVLAPYADLALVHTPRASRLQITLARTAHLLGPTDPAHGVVDVLHSRVADDLDWGPEVKALRRQYPWPRLVNRWPLPDLPDPATRRVLSGHSGVVYGVAVAPDGSWLASAGGDGKVQVWDMVSGRVRSTFSGHSRGVYGVAVAPDGSWLASAGGDGKVRVWDVVSGRVRVTLSGRAGTRPLLAVTVAPDGSWLASAGGDGKVRVWDVTSWRPRAVFTLYGYPYEVRALAGAPNGAWMASAGGDGTVRVWDMRDISSRRILVALSGHPGGVNALAVASDGAWMAFAGDDGMVRVWDMRDMGLKRVRAAIAGHSGTVRGVVAAPDASWLASVGDDGTVRIWDVS